eukprot:4580463-Ditylum_brightwellii.AAC.1
MAPLHKGRVSKQWSSVQGTFYAHMPDKCKPRSFNEEIWSLKLITTIWNIFCEVWNVRNACLHAEMKKEPSPLIDKQVKKVYMLKHSMFSTDRLLFSKSLYNRLNTSHEFKVHWFASVRVAVHDFTVVCKRLPLQRVLNEFLNAVNNADVSQNYDQQVQNVSHEENRLLPKLVM